jgi:hypothetical protein
MNKAVEDIRRACSLLVTYHRHTGNTMTELSGKLSPVVIYITSDQRVKDHMRELREPVKERSTTR